MAADLHIHIVDNGYTEADAKRFMGHSFGSKHFSWENVTDANSGDTDKWEKIQKTPNIWVGEVSWLKAALVEDGGGDYIPGHVQAVYDAIGEDLPVIDDELIKTIDAGFAVPNGSIYHDEGFEQTHAKVLAFLREHKGKQCFTVSW
jgi:hypothetical protein